ncbi:MAG: pleD [bacterium]|nr:pleD [bacterium]
MVTILIVDDDPDVLEGVAILLELHFGRCARIVTASSGAHALAVATSIRPHLIVTDYSMPNMDGPAFIQRARQQAALRDVPIVILSGEPGLAPLTRGLDVQGLVGKSDVGALLNVAHRFLPATCEQAAA